MGILDSFKNLSRPYDENDMYLDEEEFADEEFPTPEAPPINTARADSAPQSFTPAPGSTAGSFTPQRDGRVVNINTSTQLQVVIVKPEKYEVASEIADHLRERRTVVMNLENANREKKDTARRLIDFLSGVAYALEGQIQRVAANTYIITPYNVGLTGDLLDELENNGLYL